MRMLVRMLARSGWLGLANGLALAAAFAAAILLTGLVRYELAFNSTIDPSGQVHQIYTRVTPAGRSSSTIAGAAGDLAAAIRAQRPDLVVGRMIQSAERQKLSVGGVSSFETIFEADPEIARILTFAPVAGDVETALAQPDGAILTTRMATRLFGSPDCLGALFTLSGRSYRVGAVIKPLSPNSSLADLDILISGHGRGTALSDMDRPGPVVAFTIGTVRTLLVPDGPVEAIARIADQHALAVIDRMQQAAGHAGAPGMTVEHLLVRLRDLDAARRAGAAPDPNRADQMLLFSMSGLAVLVLIVAVLNVVNLSTSQAVKRATMVAVRKAFGASRLQIAAGFLGENILIAGLASVAGLGLAWMFSDWFAHLVRRPLDLEPDWGLVSLLALAGVTTGIGAGFYPALVLSGFQPAAVLGARGAQAPGAGILRRILVTLQIAASVAAIALSISVMLQLQHVTQSGLGFRADDVLVYRLPEPVGAGDPRLVSLLQDFHNVSGLVGAGLTEALPTEGQTGSTRIIDAAPSGLELTTTAVTPQMVDVLGLTVLAGHGFAQHDLRLLRSRADLQQPGPLQPIMITRGTALKLGHVDLQAAVGAILSFGGGRPWNGLVVGIIDDMPMGRLRADRMPDLVLTTNLRGARFLVLRLSPAIAPDALDALDQTYRRFFPDQPIDRIFLSDRVNAAYADIRRLLGLVVFFGGLSAGAACLGVLGMSTALAERMRREAGIRKAFGAPSLAITRLLMMRLCGPLIAGIASGVLAGWVVAREWLLTFPVRAALDGWPEIAASALVVMLTLLVTIWQIVRLACARPIETLGYE